MGSCGYDFCAILKDKAWYKLRNLFCNVLLLVTPVEPKNIAPFC